MTYKVLQIKNQSERHITAYKRLRYASPKASPLRLIRGQEVSENDLVRIHIKAQTTRIKVLGFFYADTVI